jgi:GAF domain-containing protein
MSTTALWLLAAGAALAALAFGALAVVLRRLPAAPREAADLDREAQRLREAAWFAATLDLGALALRIVEAALAASEADGAAVLIHPSDDVPGALETLQLAPAETDWIVNGLTAGNESSAIMRYPDVESAPGEERIKTALFVPVPGPSGEPFGTLAAVWRRDLGDEADGRLAVLDGVAGLAWPAIDNARRYERARRAAGRDAAEAGTQDTPERA